MAFCSIQRVHCKKRLTIFLSPARISLAKLIPVQGEFGLCRDIPAGDGKMANRWRQVKAGAVVRIYIWSSHFKLSNKTHYPIWCTHMYSNRVGRFASGWFSDFFRDARRFWAATNLSLQHVCGTRGVCCCVWMNAKMLLILCCCCCEGGDCCCGTLQLHPDDAHNVGALRLRLHGG